MVKTVKQQPIPAFDKTLDMGGNNLRHLLRQAVRSWLAKTPSKLTRVNYRRDLDHFMSFAGIETGRLEHLLAVCPEHVAAWRDELRDRGLKNSTIRRKLTVLRSLFSYLQTYGYAGANPAHGKFVKAPSVPRDGKTVGLSPADCRRLLEAPDETPAGIRDRAIFSVLAYSACRVGELVALKVGDFRISGEPRVLSIFGKGGKERLVPLHLEAVERLVDWIDTAGIAEDRSGPLFRPAASPRGRGHDGFLASGLTTRSVDFAGVRHQTPRELIYSLMIPFGREMLIARGLAQRIGVQLQEGAYFSLRISNCDVRSRHAKLIDDSACPMHEQWSHVAESQAVATSDRSS